MRCHAIVGAVVLAGTFLQSGPPPGAAEPVFPGEQWATRPHGQLGLDAEKLRALGRYVGGRGCVVRHGFMVHTWGDVAKRGDVASACKPWYTHFLLKAIEDGQIAGVDEKVIRHEPRLKNINAVLAHQDRNITWKHLANQVSCYGVEEPPATAYDYSDYNMALLFDALFLKVYGCTWKTVDAQVLHPQLTDPLQCQDRPTFMAFGTGNRPGRVGVSVRDFARFGLLYLRKGNWNGKQLISAEHVAMAVTTPIPNAVPRTKGKKAEMIPGQRSIGGGNNQTDHMGSYSYAWWINGVDRGGKRHWADVPVDAYGAFGHGGPRAMVVIPSLDLIISWNDARVRSREMENQALKMLADATDR